MGRVFQIGLGQDGNFAVSNINETAAPQMKTFLSGQFGRGFDESVVQEAMTHFPQTPNNNFKI